MRFPLLLNKPAELEPELVGEGDEDGEVAGVDIAKRKDTQSAPTPRVGQHIWDSDSDSEQPPEL